MSSDLEVKWARFRWLAVIESALDLTRPGKANEGDELGLALHRRKGDARLF